MGRLFYILVIFVLKQNVGFSQIDESINYRIRYQWVNFITEDSTYQYTLYNEQNGLFHFEVGFADSSMNPKKEFFILQKDNEKIIYKRNFHFIPEFINVFDQSQQIDKQINTYKYFELSYLLNEMKVNRIEVFDQYIFVLFPCDQTNFYNQFYFLNMQINRGLPTLYIQKWASLDINGIKLLSEDSVKIKQKDYERLEKKLYKIDGIENVFCSDPDNTILFEFKLNHSTRRHILTSYCEEQKSGHLLKTYYWFLRLNNLHTNLDCSSDLQNLFPISY